MNSPSKLALLVTFALFMGLGCQIANGLADKPTPVPSPLAIVPTVVVPTVGALATRTLPPVPATATLPIAPTASPTSLVAVLTSTPAAQSSCPNPNAAITYPGMNSMVSGLIEIRGTATQPDMQYWKVEYRTEITTAYSGLNNTTTAVTDGVLARWSTKTVPNGVYFIRLVVVQKDGNFATPCEIRITIAN